MQPYPRSLMAGSAAWHGLPQCPGYGHCLSYCCVALPFGSGLWLGVGFGNPASPGWGLGRVCLGMVCGVVPLLLAGVTGVCGWAWVLACTPPFVFRVMGCALLRARSASTPPFPVPVCGVGVRAGSCASAAPRHSLGRCWGVCVLVCPPRVVSCSSWLGVLCGGVLLVPRPATPGCGLGVRVCLCARPACSPPFLAGVCCVGVRAGRWSRLCPASLGWVVGVCFFFGGGGVSCFGFVVSVAGCPGPGSCGLCPPIPSLSGCVAGYFFFSSQRGVCPRVLGVPFPAGPLLLAWCCRFWLGGPPVPLWGLLPSVPSEWGVWPPLAVLVGRVVDVGLGGLRGLPGCCCWLRSAWPSPSAMGRVGYVHVVLSAPSGWAAAPGGFVWLWVRGAGVVRVLSPPRCRF